ncbi:MAG: hypothetical protein ACD_47C00572G0002 [uncultured bacterium]|uniref:NADH-quinone oxidoreductase subunit N n=1 Tax=Candidatus Wallbacteria bacterium GWC2_49_35 TaxID=1817813 RepID=A0A1F7WKR7_9BACT|nr:MAG: hypothetical protein ACD_47C00572G0002 [uncultured bacterium]OGM02728.1 MAG: hypothetical protein A2008_06410 [Candidatus Wallbacteria bacterium GWC2_49_35]HBC74299.1 hypothetical protein [Candidatus Wallbacteria bacterium]
MSKEELAVNLYAISPMIALLITAAVVAVISASKDALTPAGRIKAIDAAGKLTAAAFACAALISAGHFIRIKGPLTLFYNAIFFDHYSAAACFIFSVMGIFTVLIAFNELKTDNPRYRPEYFTMLLCAASGTMIMAMANDLIVALIGIEILSVSTYIMCAIDFKNKRAVEGAFKYFLTGAAASAIFLFGLAHIYGGARTTLISEMARFASLNADAASGGLFTPLLTGFVFVSCALLFKAAAVPFHNWAPDVYDAASVSVAAFMTYFVKAAVFVLIFRIFGTAFIFLAPPLLPIFVIISAVTMTLANIAALFQNNIKRMLAYSSISHTAYILIAVISSVSAFKNITVESGAYIIFYLVSYFFINAAAFSALALVKAHNHQIHTIDDLRGCGFSRPLFSAAFALSLLALAGIPSTSGFIAKFLVFYNAFLANHHALVLIAVVNSLIAFYYYIKIIMAMYMQKPEDRNEVSCEPATAGRAETFCLAFSAVMVLALGIFPGPAIELAKLAVMKSF